MGSTPRAKCCPRRIRVNTLPCTTKHASYRVRHINPSEGGVRRFNGPPAKFLPLRGLQKGIIQSITTGSHVIFKNFSHRRRFKTTPQKTTERAINFPARGKTSGPTHPAHAPLCPGIPRNCAPLPRHGRGCAWFSAKGNGDNMSGVPHLPHRLAFSLCTRPTVPRTINTNRLHRAVRRPEAITI